MDLLETVLSSGGFGEFVENFRANKIDSFSLKLLSDQDLELLGIEDGTQRQKLMEVINNLQIPAEKRSNTKGDTAYALLVLTNICLQLQKQFANLTYILKREDIDICDIQLTPAVLALQNNISSMESTLNVFERKVLKVPKKKKKKLYFIIPTLIISSMTLFTCGRYLLKNS
ncbi:uncharacterized protein LOC130902010 [Diorhabda carinulata]|uniref:uncharacterized protein LOC130902010 n=1 Tax=Diorhabda carinulata TaxID=1163345 RepID=UPI0025A2C2AB|nr:uncharacterized protein LOC130902010 [Diorhabda carinulata]